MYMPNTQWTWSFFLVCLFQCMAALALEGYVFGQFQASLELGPRKNDPPSEALTIPTYLALFIFGFIYELFLVWDALRLQNTIQVIGICLCNLALLIYAAVEMSQVDKAVYRLETEAFIEPGTWLDLRPYLIAGPCVIALGSASLAFIAWKLYDEFAWTIYKHISADLGLKRRFLTYQIYIALLKFDFFFFLGFTVQFLVVVPHTTRFEFWLTIAALPITIALLFLAAYFTQRESRPGQILVICVYFAGMAYFVFKLVRMYDAGPRREEEYLPARNSLTLFAILTLLALVVTMVVACVCMRNFGKGLEPHIGGRRRGRGRTSAEDGKFGSAYGGDGLPSHILPLGQVQGRMTID